MIDVNPEAETSSGGGRIVAKFRGLLPMFVELYAKNLGARYEDGEMSGEGWRAKVTYRKVRIGSIALTETEMTFEGDPSKVDDFLTKFRAISLRNWG
ncbi:MAG: hypothetical protein ABSD41_00560 [Candidatus Bathyarchaeia archaeon]